MSSSFVPWWARVVPTVLALVLAIAGVELILSETPVGTLPIPLTLGVIVVTLAGSIVWSLLATPARPVDAEAPRTPVGT